MKKIVIIGSPGSGKSTVAQKLGKMLQINVFHLDAFYWKPGWKPVTRNEIATIQNELVKKDAWIIDGNFQSTIDIRLQAADTVIFLDYSRWTCVFRAIKRSFIHFNKTRPDMGEGCVEKFDISFYKWILSFPKKNRPEIMNKLKEYKKEKAIVIIKSNADLTNFLRKAKNV